MIASKTFFLIITFLTVFTTSAFAQDPPAAVGGNGVQKMVQAQSLANLSPTEKFSSIDGKFTIVLPQSISGFAALTPQNTGTKGSGGSYNWKVKEGTIIINYIDFNGSLSIKTEQDYVDFFAGAKDAVLSSFKGQLVSDALIKLEKYRGYKFSFQSANGATGECRVFWAQNREYLLIGINSKNFPNAEQIISQKFDTLSFISQETINAELKNRLEQATPKPLPQTPVVQKLKSDAEDENLKGKIKTIVEESEDLSGAWSYQGRHYSSIEDYNEIGNLLKRVAFDSKANPFEVTVYGYLDNSRVSNSKMVSYEYDPPPMMISASPAGKTKKPLDTSYEYKLQYKYASGNLTEMQMVRNNGDKWLRYVYSYNGNQKEELIYDEEGKINQKYLYILDDKGNEIEQTDFDVLQPQIYGDRKYKNAYENFDDKGNWTKKTISKLVTENGKQVYKPYYIEYRTITYYP